MLNAFHVRRVTLRRLTREDPQEFCWKFSKGGCDAGGHPCSHCPGSLRPKVKTAEKWYDVIWVQPMICSPVCQMIKKSLRLRIFRSHHEIC